MAIQSLETKIDSMVQDDQVNPIGVDSTAGALPETAAAPTDIVDQQTFEPYEVAGLGLGMVKQALKKAPAKTAAPILKAGEEVGKVGPYQVIKEATPKVAEDILQAGDADLIALARAFLYKPRWAWEAAAALDGTVSANERYWRCLPREAQAIFGDVKVGQR